MRKRLLIIGSVLSLLLASAVFAAQSDLAKKLDEATPASVEELTAQYGKPAKVWKENGQQRMSWKQVKAVIDKGGSGSRLTVTALAPWSFGGLKIGAPLSAVHADNINDSGWTQIGPTGRSLTMIFRLTKSPEKAKFLMVEPDKRQKKVVAIWWFIDEP